MLERTYAQTALRSETLDFLPSLEVNTNSLMQRVKGGVAPQALSELLGLKNLGLFTGVPFAGIQKGSAIRVSVKQNQAKIEKYLNDYSNNPDFILNFGTITAKSAETSLLKEYNLVSSHAYSIIGYDPATKIVKIANPHGFSTVTEVPVDILSKYIQVFDITRLN